MSNTWESDWRKRSRARGVNPDKIMRKVQAAKAPSAAPMPSAGGARPRAGEPAVRPDRASREGVLSKQASLMTTLARISRSELKDEDKQKLYDTAGASESMVAAAVRAISEDGEVQDAQAVADAQPKKASDLLLERAGGATNPQFEAAIRRLRKQERLAAKREPDPEQVAAQVEGQFQEMTRDDPWWMDTLMFVDRYTRSPVVAAFSQLGAVIDDELGYDPDGTKSVASWDRFWDQWQNNTMTSELMDPNMPGWARFLLGTTVDIALDPLTYLTGGSAAVAKVTGKGGMKLAGLVGDASALASKNAGDLLKAVDLGDEAAGLARQTLLKDSEQFAELAGRVQSQGGFAGLGKADRALAERALKSTEFLTGKQSLRGGVYFRLPGTEGFRIPVLSEALTPISRGTSRGTTGLRGRISHPFMTEKRGFLKQFSQSDLFDKQTALSALLGTVVGDNARMFYQEKLLAQRGGLMLRTRRLQEATKMTDEDIIRWLDAPDALGADGLISPVNAQIAKEGTEGPTAKIMDGWREWWELGRASANDAMGDTTDLLGRPEFLARRNDYTFHSRLRTAEDLVDRSAASGRGGVDPIGPEQYANVAAGRVYRGVDIVDPLVHPLRLSPEDQAVEILRAQAVKTNIPGAAEEITKMFSKDLDQITSTYVNVVGSRIASLKMSQTMVEQGTAISSKNLKRIQAGRVWKDRERQLQRARFPVDVARIRAARDAAVAAGGTPPAAAAADVLQMVDDIAAVRTGALSVEQATQRLVASTARMDVDVAEVTRLGVRAEQLLNDIAEETQRLYRAGDADEMFDLTLVSVSASTKRLADELADVEMRLASLAAGFEPQVMARLLQSDGLLAMQKKSIVDRINYWSAMDVSLGKRAEDGTRSWFRNSADMVVNKEQVVRELDAARNQLDYVTQVQVARDKARSVYDSLEDFATSQDRQFGELMRALTPGSDGIARLADGEVANFARTGVVRGDGAFDRIGPRFPLADDVDAADARMLGDVGGLADDVALRAGRGEPNTDLLASQLDEVNARIAGVEQQMFDSARVVPEGEVTAGFARTAETDRIAQELWDSPSFQTEHARLVKDANNAISAERYIAEAVDPSPELLTQTTRRVLDDFVQKLRELAGEGENLGGIFTSNNKIPLSGGTPVQGKWSFPLDVSRRGYRRKNVKGGWTRGKVRGGEYDWWDNLGSKDRSYIARTYLGKGGGKGSKPDQFAQEFKLAADGGALGKATANMSTSVDDWADEFLGWIVRWEEANKLYSDIQKFARPRAGDRDALLNILKSPEVDAFDLRYMESQLDRMPYTPEQYRAIRGRIEELGANRTIKFEQETEATLRKLTATRDRMRQQLDDLQGLGSAPPPRKGAGLFKFQTTVAKPRMFTGRNAEASMHIDVLHNAVRNGDITLKPATQLDSVDKLMWNQTVEAINNFAKITDPSNRQLELFAERLNSMIRGFAQADPESLAGRVAAASDSPAQGLLDSIVNIGALGRTERELLGDWDALLASTRHSPDAVASGYRKRLGASGFDGVMLDNGTLRELVSFSPQSMRPQNAASQMLLRLEDAQVAVKNRLSKLRTQEQTLAQQWGFNPSWQTFDRQAAEAAKLANSNAKSALTRLQGEGKLGSQGADELALRESAVANFGYASAADKAAADIVAELDKAYAAQVRQVPEGFTAAARQDNPSQLARIEELRNDADNYRLIAQADVGDADSVAAGLGSGYDRLFTGNLAEQPGLAENLTLLLTQNLKQLNNGAHAPAQIVDVVNAAMEFMQPEGTRKFLRVLDYLTGMFKSYAVMTPGFVTRNMVGGAMNNWLGLVNIKSYREFYRADKLFRDAIQKAATDENGFRAGYKAINDKMGPKAAKAYEDWLAIAPAVSGGMAAAFAGDVGVSAASAIERSGIRTAMVGSERGVQAFGKTFDLPVANARQSVRDNTATRAFFYINTRSEYKLRGPMAWDELMRKGGDQVSATQRIYQFHFDYSPGGVSRLERNVLKRAIPFYVWIANNVPLQLKSLVTRPKVAAAYIKVKQNMEELSEDEAIMPSYFSRLGGIRLPFKDADGNHMYFMPDLPVRDLGMFNLDKIKFSLNPIELGGSLVETNELLSSINPWFKMPAETLLLERKVFTDAPFRDGYVPIPKAVQKIPGLPQALQLLGQYKRDADGQPMADEKVLYALETLNPWLARANRLFPADGDEALQARRMSTLLSIFVGVGFRTNSFRDQSNELFKRQDALDSELRKFESLGVEFQTASEIKRSDKEQAAIAGWEQMPAESNYLLNVLNSGDVDAIKELDGFGDVSAAELLANIQAYGEFTDLQDLGSADGVSQSAVTKALEALSERKTASLDFATADMDDLIAMPGIGPKSAPKIQAYARANGGIRNLGELRQFGLSNKDIQALDVWLREEREFQRMLVGVR
jgi:DNA uptake protein ComE-like DNA-binding protein